LIGLLTSPNKGDGSNKLLAVSGTASNDVWAVGSFFNTNSGTNQTLTEHWDGSSWSIVYSPIAPSSSDNALNSVRAIGKNNVWAVGFYIGVPFGPQLTLTEKYA
jgi:hypothetical protein